MVSAMSLVTSKWNEAMDMDYCINEALLQKQWLWGRDTRFSKGK